MLSYGLANFRRLRDINPIPLKPITILVGRNSSGKSSFLRSLPLLNQSISTDTSGTILWWSDLVDFGSFADTIHSDHTDREISFKFIIDELDITRSNRYYYPFYFDDNIYENIGELASKDVEVCISVTSESGDLESDTSQTFICKYIIKIKKLFFVIEFDKSGKLVNAQVNGEALTDSLTPLSPSLEKNSIFPRFDYRRREAGVVTRPVPPEYLSKIYEIISKYSPAFQPDMVGGRSSTIALQILSSTFNDYLHETLSSGIEAPVKKSRRSKKADAQVHSILHKMNSDDRALFEKNALIYVMPLIFAAISHLLTAQIEKVSYIGPARVRSERFYRQQDLSVSTIASDGTNFPMFLASLTPSQVEEFSNEVKALYDYGVKVEKRAGHISIILTQGDFNVNLIDTGYGVSQILPVLGQMWWAGKQRPMRASPISIRADSIVAIEQPELHLHPAHQAKLAEAFARYSKLDGHEKRRPLKFLVETHSETLINRLGELIYEKKLKSDDVQVVIFEDDAAQKNATKARIASFKDDGSLSNWPFGFFGV